MASRRRRWSTAPKRSGRVFSGWFLPNRPKWSRGDRFSRRSCASRPHTATDETEEAHMDWKLELVAVPVSDVDRARDFYAKQAGFTLDHDHTVNEQLRFVQLTPPGSGCSIALGTGLSTMVPGSLQGLQLVVADVEA